MCLLYIREELYNILSSPSGNWLGSGNEWMNECIGICRLNEVVCPAISFNKKLNKAANDVFVFT